jgi:hypothetical protein
MSTMDFDQILESWRDRDALRQALQTEEAKVRQEHLLWRRVLWFPLIFGTGMAIFAGFWIPISITNGWPVIYVITSGVSVGMFALAVGAAPPAAAVRESALLFPSRLRHSIRRPALPLLVLDIDRFRHYRNIQDFCKWKSRASSPSATNCNIP